VLQLIALAWFGTPRISSGLGSLQESRLARAILGRGPFQCDPNRDRLSTVAASEDAVAFIPEVRALKGRKPWHCAGS
jgi:hypothetical protein